MVLLPIDRGRVRCPFDGDVDIDACFGCEHLVEVVDERDDQVVRCLGRPRPRVEASLLSPPA